MRAYNSIEDTKFSYVISLRGAFPVEWQYQFIDVLIKKPKYKDRSDFHNENQFSTPPIGAKQALMENCTNP